MALTERHRWCTSKMLETFAPELDMETVQGFIRVEGNNNKFTSFFKGEGPGRLFVFYQSEGADGEVRYDAVK
jgi:hypothetical protein